MARRSCLAPAPRGHPSPHRLAPFERTRTVRHEARFATVDRGIPPATVRKATKNNLLVTGRHAATRIRHVECCYVRAVFSDTIRSSVIKRHGASGFDEPQGLKL